MSQGKHFPRTKGRKDALGALSRKRPMVLPTLPLESSLSRCRDRTVVTEVLDYCFLRHSILLLLLLRAALGGPSQSALQPQPSPKLTAGARPVRPSAAPH